MKKITVLMLVFLASLCTYGQQSLELKIKEGADAPNTSLIQFYLLEITNTTNNIVKFKISTKDINCENIPPEHQVTLNKNVVYSTKTKELTTNSLSSNNSLEFYLKLSRPNMTPVNKWNCTEVKAITSSGAVLSNAILIKSLIPDPSQFN